LATGFSAAVFAVDFVVDEGALFTAAFAAGFLAVAIIFSPSSTMGNTLLG